MTLRPPNATVSANPRQVPSAPPTSSRLYLVLFPKRNGAEGLSTAAPQTSWTAVFRGFETNNSSAPCGVASWPSLTVFQSSFPRFFREVRALRRLEDDWDSYGAPAPNAAAVAHAEEVLGVLCELDLEPTSVGPCADGGVAITFARGVRTALFECFNTGEMVSGTSSGPGTTEVRDVTLDQCDLRSSL